MSRDLVPLRNSLFVCVDIDVNTASAPFPHNHTHPVLWHFGTSVTAAESALPSSYLGAKPNARHFPIPRGPIPHSRRVFNPFSRDSRGKAHAVVGIGKNTTNSRLFRSMSFVFSGTRHKSKILQKSPTHVIKTTAVL